MVDKESNDSPVEHVHQWERFSYQPQYDCSMCASSEPDRRIECSECPEEIRERDQPDSFAELWDQAVWP